MPHNYRVRQKDGVLTIRDPKSAYVLSIILQNSFILNWHNITFDSPYDNKTRNARTGKNLSSAKLNIAL